MRSRLHAKVAPAGLLLALLIAGCGGDEARDQPTPTIDSRLEFSGVERDVASVLEEFQEAVTSLDTATLCGQIYAVQENRHFDSDNGGQALCERDPLLSPESELQSHGGADGYDVVVESVNVSEGGNASLPWRARATANAEVGGQSETFMLQRGDGGWRIVARGFVDRDRTGPRPYGFALGCRSNSLLSVSVLSISRTPRRDSARAALLANRAFGEALRKRLDRGGRLQFAGTAFAPDYIHVFLERDSAGRPVANYPVQRLGAEWDTSQRARCDG